MVKKLVMLLMLMPMMALAATFTGELYGSYYEDEEDCGIWHVKQSWKNGPDWRDDYVNVDGVKEPAQYCSGEYAFEVSVTPGEQFTAEIVHLTSTAAHVKSCTVLSDAEMYARYSQGEDEDDLRSVWPTRQPSSTRAWVLVAFERVSSDDTYAFNLSKCPIINDPDYPAYYNPADGEGGLSSKWTVEMYAAKFGATLSGKRRVSASVSMTVQIVETGEQFPSRVWSVQDPFSAADVTALDRIDARGGDSELIDAPGLYFVTQEMIENQKNESHEQAYGPFVAGDKVEFDIGLVGYTAKGLPSGLKYDSKKGIVSGAVKAAGEYEATFTKKGEDDETVIFTVRAEEVSVGCEGLSLGAFTSGVAGGADGIPLEIETETGVKSVAVTKLPTGMKYDAKSGLITGAPTKAGDYEVVVTVTTKSGAKQVVTIPVMVAALPENVIGTFNGFVKADDGVENQGTFQLTTTDAGKLTAKVTTAEGSYSFSGTCWDAVEGGVYSVVLATKKGEKLALSLNAAAGWNEYQLEGAFTAVSSKPPYQVVARKNAFGKTWYFNAAGNEAEGWTLSYAENAKAANLTVTLNADGSTKIAGKLGTLNVSGSGYSDVTAVQDGAIIADFAPVVSMKEGKATVKRILSIRANLWFDRSNEMHSGDIGSVKIIPGA